MPKEIYIASIVFFIISVIGLMVVMQVILKPLSFLRTATRSSGINYGEIAGRDKDIMNATKFLFNYAGSAMLGSNLLTLIISLTAFRQQEVWAWYALWYWPVMFIWHLFIFEKFTIMWYMQAFWLVLTAGVLVWTKPFFI